VNSYGSIKLESFSLIAPETISLAKKKNFPQTKSLKILFVFQAWMRLVIPIGLNTFKYLSAYRKLRAIEIATIILSNFYD